MKKFKKFQKQIYISLGVICIAILVGFLLRGLDFTRAEVLENDVKVAENSDLTYYLDISYDGKDKDVTSSSDTTRATIYSDTLYVEDKVPEGLIFKEFVDPGNGTIGAVQRDDPNQSCSGYVDGGVAGLNYDPDTGLVSFRVRNLQAGCKITVGIVTTTPSLNGQNRMDFYNTAFAREFDYSTKSNTVHVFMGQETVPLFKVTYEYTGDVPENAPALPSESTYAAGTTVGVEKDAVLDGYTFSGWSSDDVTPSGGNFIMPSQDVVFQGSFTAKETFDVSYRIEGDAPEDYAVPRTRSYGEGDEVAVDSLQPGDIVDGYRFLGWTHDTIDLSNGTFTMPGEDVEIVGSFELVTYQVSYQFQGAVIPPNADSLLPETKSYVPGETVTREADPVASGYTFLGWYSEESFVMPEQDVIIYGEWALETGTFSPTIEKTIPDQKSQYMEGEVVPFTITVTNNADFPISDVMVSENTAGSTFVEGNGYELLNSNHARIPTLEAGGQVVLSAQYTAGSEAYREITNEVEITGAIANNNYYLDTTKEYKDEVTFVVANISLTIHKTNEKGEPLDGAEFTLYEDNTGSDAVGTGLNFENLEINKTYYLKETRTPTGYVLLDNMVPVRVSSSGEISIDGYQISGSNGAYEVTIANQPIDIFPNTGGIGIMPFVIGGAVICGGVAIGFIFYLKRQKKK